MVRQFFNQSQAVAIAKLLLKSNYNFVLRQIYIFRNVNENFKNCKLRSYPEGFANTVKALPTDTLISGQLYLRPPSQNPVFLNSHTNSVFSDSGSSYGHLFRVPMVSAYESFHCILNTYWIMTIPFHFRPRHKIHRFCVRIQVPGCSCKYG